jgi:hypothetical protein
MLIIVKLNTDVPSSPLPRRMTIAIQSTHLHTCNPVPLNPTRPRKPFTSIPAAETFFHLFDCAELVRNSPGQEKANFEPHQYKHSQGIRSGNEEAVSGSTQVLDQLRAGFEVGFWVQVQVVRGRFGLREGIDCVRASWRRC